MITPQTVTQARLVAKRLQLLHELVPAATSIAALFNPSNAVGTETQTRELQVAARILGVRLLGLTIPETLLATADEVIQ
jgi:putative tryptophan/tyrosine transport system substrate-binding protein